MIEGVPLSETLYLFNHQLSEKYGLKSLTDKTGLVFSSSNKSKYVLEHFSKPIAWIMAKDKYLTELLKLYNAMAAGGGFLPIELVGETSLKDKPDISKKDKFDTFIKQAKEAAEKFEEASSFATPFNKLSKLKDFKEFWNQLRSLLTNWLQNESKMLPILTEIKLGLTFSHSSIHHFQVLDMVEDSKSSTVYIGLLVIQNPPSGEYAVSYELMSLSKFSNFTKSFPLAPYHMPIIIKTKQFDNWFFQFYPAETVVNFPVSQVLSVKTKSGTVVRYDKGLGSELGIIKSIEKEPSLDQETSATGFNKAIVTKFNDLSLIPKNFSFSAFELSKAKFKFSEQHHRALVNAFYNKMLSITSSRLFNFDYAPIKSPDYYEFAEHYRKVLISSTLEELINRNIAPYEDSKALVSFLNFKGDDIYKLSIQDVGSLNTNYKEAFCKVIDKNYTTYAPTHTPAWTILKPLLDSGEYSILFSRTSHPALEEGQSIAHISAQTCIIPDFNIELFVIKLFNFAGPTANMYVEPAIDVLLSMNSKSYFKDFEIKKKGHLYSFNFDPQIFVCLVKDNYHIDKNLKKFREKLDSVSDIHKYNVELIKRWL